jgi:hypothetical protein
VALVEIVGLLLILRHVLSGRETWCESKPVLVQATLSYGASTYRASQAPRPDET